MKFNANKFELLRCGKEQEIKTATLYKSYVATPSEARERHNHY